MELVGGSRVNDLCCLSFRDSSAAWHDGDNLTGCEQECVDVLTPRFARAIEVPTSV